jgi:hypothetical protein
MFRSHSIKTKARKADRASTSEIQARFTDKRGLFLRLALLITREKTRAERSVAEACEMAIHGQGPFRDCLTDWAKWMTIKTTISENRDAICSCEPAYDGKPYAHGEQLFQSTDSKRKPSDSFLFWMDPGAIITQLDPLALQPASTNRLGAIS